MSKILKEAIVFFENHNYLLKKGRVNRCSGTPVKETKKRKF